MCAIRYSEPINPQNNSESLSHVPSQPLWTVIKGEAIQFIVISITDYSSFGNDCFRKSCNKSVKSSGSG
jgi:hypothetical protein